MKVLMVCLGNICRSPVAEGLMRHHAVREGLNLEIDSCGTASYHIGEPPDRRSQASTAKHGVDISMLKARHFALSDFKHFDHILCMDKNNMNDILALIHDESDRNKVSLFLETVAAGQHAEVPDPYYGSESDFDQVYRVVDEGCKAWIEKWKKT